MKVMVIPVVVVRKGTGRFGNKRTSRDQLNYSIIKIVQNSEKSPGDLQGFVVTQTPMKNPQE